MGLKWKWKWKWKSVARKVAVAVMVVGAVGTGSIVTTTPAHAFTATQCVDSLTYIQPTCSIYTPLSVMADERLQLLGETPAYGLNPAVCYWAETQWWGISEPSPVGLRGQVLIYFKSTLKVPGTPKGGCAFNNPLVDWPVQLLAVPMGEFEYSPVWPAGPTKIGKKVSGDGCANALKGQKRAHQPATWNSLGDSPYGCVPQIEYHLGGQSVWARHFYYVAATITTPYNTWYVESKHLFV